MSGRSGFWSYQSGSGVCAVKQYACFKSIWVMEVEKRKACCENSSILTICIYFCMYVILQFLKITLKIFNSWEEFWQQNKTKKSRKWWLKPKGCLLFNKEVGCVRVDLAVQWHSKDPGSSYSSSCPFSVFWPSLSS